MVSQNEQSKPESFAKMSAPESPKKKMVKNASKSAPKLPAEKEITKGIESKKDGTNENQIEPQNSGVKNKSSKKEQPTETKKELESEPESPPREMTQEEIAKEKYILDQAEQKLKALKHEATEKEIIFNKLLLELRRMVYIFNKVKEVDINTSGTELNNESEKVSKSEILLLYLECIIFYESKLNN